MIYNSLKKYFFFGVSTFIKVAHLVDTLYILTILEEDQV